jgi:hypothetical protein
VKDCTWWYEICHVTVTYGTQRSHKRHAVPILTEVLRPVLAFPRLFIPPTMGGSRAIRGIKALHVKRLRDSSPKDTYLRHRTHLLGEQMISRDSEIIRAYCSCFT